MKGSRSQDYKYRQNSTQVRMRMQTQGTQEKVKQEGIIAIMDEE